jgi:hypothetical protein
MPVSIKGSGGGSVTLDAGAAATDTTLTLPNTTGTILQSGTAVTVAQGGTGVATLTSNAVLIGNGTSAVTAVSPTTTGNVLFTTDGSTWSATQKIVQGTAVASTSGTSIDFTSIPSWVKRVTVMFKGVSTTPSTSRNGLIQIGSGSVATTGYRSVSNIIYTTTTNGQTVGVNSTEGFYFILNTTTGTLSGSISINLISSNTYVASGVFSDYAFTSTVFSSGDVTLSGALDRVRITTVGGVDTFDAGSINILYE